jgi:hypothetical protein
MVQLNDNFIGATPMHQLIININLNFIKMKTIEVNLYKFDELSIEAKEAAIEYYRENRLDCSHIYDEARDTIEAFENHFPTNNKWGTSMFDCYAELNDGVEELRGLRLRTYILNNYGYILDKGKYYGKLSKKFKDGTPIPISKEHPAGCRHIKRYSKVFVDDSCNLTGVCYDDSMLQPIYNFIYFGFKNESISLLDVLDDCYKAIKEDIRSEEKYMNSDEYITEQLMEEGVIFDKEGNVF